MKKDFIVIKLILTDYWFDKIKSGEKRHEYRIFKPFWLKKIVKIANILEKNNKFLIEPFGYVTFQKAYHKNPELMTFEIKSITILKTWINTDLKTKEAVFDIELGKKID